MKYEERSHVELKHGNVRHEGIKPGSLSQRGISGRGEWKVYVVFIAIAEAVGVLSAALTRNGIVRYEDIIKPDIAPPDIVFPIVWTILYALMGIGAARIWLSPQCRMRTVSLIIFFVQLAVNFFWSPIFFNLQAFGFAFLWLLFLWLLILVMILAFRYVDRGAALLQIPYLLWVTFAGYLNYMIWMLNM